MIAANRHGHEINHVTNNASCKCECTNTHMYLCNIISIYCEMCVCMCKKNMIIMHIKEKQATGKKFDLVTCLRFSFEERTLNHRTGVKFALRDKRKSLLMTKIGSHYLAGVLQAQIFTNMVKNSRVNRIS